MRTCRHALPVMREQGSGVITNISSIAAVCATDLTAYKTSKAALNAYTHALATGNAKYGIRANAIQPAGIEGSRLGVHAGEDRERQTTPLAALPRPKPWMLIRRQGHARDEYGATVAFLLSDDAGYITGTSIPVDGGYLAT